MFKKNQKSFLDFYLLIYSNKLQYILINSQFLFSYKNLKEKNPNFIRLFGQPLYRKIKALCQSLFKEPILQIIANEVCSVEE